jgi:hypothetical protein
MHSNRHPADGSLQGAELGEKRALQTFEEVPHLLAFGFEVAPAGFVDLGDAGHAFGDNDARRFDGAHFSWIIRHQTNRVHAKVAQDGSRELITAEVAFESEPFVGFHGIGAVILKLIGAELVHKSDAAAFLQFVNDEAAAFAGDFGEGDFELRAAIAAEAVEDVSGEALGVNAKERRGILAAHVAHHQGNGFFERISVMPFEAVNPERPVFGGKRGLGGLAQFELSVVGDNPIIMSKLMFSGSAAWNNT